MRKCEWCESPLPEDSHGCRKYCADGCADEKQKQYMREYNSRPENKEMKREYQRKYEQRPEVKKRREKQADEELLAILLDMEMSDKAIEAFGFEKVSE